MYKKIKRIILSSYKKQFSQYSKKTFIVLGFACLIIALVPLCLFFSYTKPTINDMDSLTLTLKSSYESTIRIKRNRTSWLITANEVCGKLSFSNGDLFDFESFHRNVLPGERFTCKISKDDRKELVDCHTVNLYELKSKGKTYINLSDAIDLEVKNRTLAAPLVGVMFLFFTFVCFFGLYLNKKYRWR